MTTTCSTVGAVKNELNAKSQRLKEAKVASSRSNEVISLRALIVGKSSHSKVSLKFLNRCFNFWKDLQSLHT